MTTGPAARSRAIPWRLDFSRPIRGGALIATIPAGNYTAIVQGANAGAGIGLVEIYDLDL